MLKIRKQATEKPDMVNVQTNEPPPLRLWPGVVAAMLLVLAKFVVPIVAPEATLYGFIGVLFSVLAIVIWWLFFSRAFWSERIGAIVLMVVALFATSRFLHESVAKGNFGFQFFVYAIPVLSLAFVAWAVVGRHLADGPRRAAMVATILLTCGVYVLFRSDGLTGDGAPQFAWRWAETSEERLLAQGRPVALPLAPAATETSAERPMTQTGDRPAVSPTEPARMESPKPQMQAPASAELAAPSAATAAVETAADWPGFRGRERDGIIRGVRIETDWSASPPVELWRRPIGPGVSSFAVRGDLLYTHEQRGDDEVVACYNVTTGEPVWMHSDSARFWDSHVGAGPRATPALSPDGRGVYTFGATGIMNALDAGNGAVVWSRNAASDTDAKVPYFGFTSSPLVVGDLVIVAVRGQLVAYDLATGAPRWFGQAGRESYSSPHLMTIDGVAQILLLNGASVISVAPADGKLLWEHRWPGASIVQPALIAGGDVLISASGDIPIGIRRIAVTHEPGGWTIKERWTSSGLKSYFNDLVVHDGYAFGFDGRILACIDLEDGKRKWKGGRYGAGQMVLLPEQDLLLVLSEQGELALVAAASDQFTEIARFPALEGKTWNHPVLVGDILLVRNGQEMAAFRLSLMRS